MKISELNINDHSDVEIARGLFDGITSAEWEKYVSYAFDINMFTYDDKNLLKQMKFKAHRANSLSPKQVFKSLTLIEKIDEAVELREKSRIVEDTIEKEMYHQVTKHVTFRLAWHDSGWNGHICDKPSLNRYCSGFHSLLSDRIRKRKAKNIQEEETYKTKSLNEIDYIPPCFWSINLFSENNIKIKHDNPAAPDLGKIGEELPSNSLFSWPFAISFTRSKKEIERDGSYPANLENVRIPFFNAKIIKEKSIGFFYSNYSNPFTEEEGKYLLIGCGIISDKGSLHKFGPPNEIRKIRDKSKKLSHFPATNWAIRFSFDSLDNMVRIPYHEYIDYSQKHKLSEEEKDKLFDSIKVSITEPELEHCFKYVAMDIDDDEAIYLLTKIKQKLLQIQNKGIVNPEDIQTEIDKTNYLLSFCWQKRDYLPGFENICKAILNHSEQLFPLSDLIDKLKSNESDYIKKLIELFETPNTDKTYKSYLKYIEAVIEKLSGAYGITINHFFQLAMLNLKKYQFERILEGKIENPKTSTYTVEEICNNPYLLFEDYVPNDSNIDESTGDIIDSPIELFKIDIAYYPDINFSEKIELQRNYKYDDKRRIRALIINYLNSLENTGDCFDEAENIETAIKNYPLFYNAGGNYILPKNFLLKLTDDTLLHFSDKLKVISANDTRYFYLQWLYEYEKELEKVFQTLLDEPNNTKFYSQFDNHLKNSKLKLSALLEKENIRKTFEEERTKLYKNIYQKRLFVIAGNPGSGKSYELLNIIKDLEEQRENYLLLAPTGKATLRLKNDDDFKGVEASTIDKLIADIKSGKRSKTSVLNANNIIIDEMSMVDLMKFHELLEYINYKSNTFKRLILVGDPNQLPPIGFGKILRDIISYCKTNPKYENNIIELTTNCRMELANSRLLDLSSAFTYKGEIDEDLKKLIISGKQEISEGLRIRFWNDEDSLYNQIIQEFDILCGNVGLSGNLKSKLNKILALNEDGTLDITKGFNLENFQIVTPYKSSYYGSTFINELIQEKFKPDDELEIMSGWFKQSDKVIRTKNYYDGEELIISNGSIGLIRKENKDILYLAENNYNKIEFNSIRKGEREFFELAYCITVHKSQGSGFDHTFMILPQKLGLLSRELVYTALTRCRKSITLFIEGDNKSPFEKSILEKARKRSYTEFRKTTLLLSEPYRYYSLEPEPGIFVESRIELMIYYSLMQTRERLGSNVFQFAYEIMPIVNGKTIPIKTDFTIYCNGKTYYWEHLGRLNEKEYARKWKEIKFPTYEKFEVTNQLITTDEIYGINPHNIEIVVQDIVKDRLSMTDKLNKYSKHHYSLR